MRNNVSVDVVHQASRALVVVSCVNKKLLTCVLVDQGADLGTGSIQEKRKLRPWSSWSCSKNESVECSKSHLFIECMHPADSKRNVFYKSLWWHWWFRVCIWCLIKTKNTINSRGALETPSGEKSHRGFTYSIFNIYKSAKIHLYIRLHVQIVLL